MSAVEELTRHKENGFAFGILGRAILELAEEEAVTNGFAHVVAEWAENAQDRCEKLEERVKALEDLTKRHLRLHIKEEISEPTPAPDLDAQITETIEDIKSLFALPPDTDIPATEGHLRKILRAFAGAEKPIAAGE